MNRLAMLAILPLATLGAVGLACGNISETQPEQGAGPSNDAGRVLPDATVDPALDAGKSEPQCLRTAALGPFSPILAEGIPLQVRYLRTSRDGKRVYYVLAASPTVVRTAELIQGELKNARIALETPLAIHGGIAVSASGLTLYVTFNGTTIVSYTRSTVDESFGGAGKAAAFTPTAPSTGDLIWYPYVAHPPAAEGDVLLFGLFQVSDAGLHHWDIVRGSMHGEVVSGSIEANVKPNPTGYVFAPVQSDALHLLFAQWGSSVADGYPRIFQTKRSTPTGVWETPQPLTIAGYNPVAPHVAIPLDETANGCTVFFGEAPGLSDIVYAVYRSERPH